MSFEPPELHAPHALKEKPKINWLELIVSLAALLVSGVSIAVAMHHGDVMERLVAANSLPYLEIRNSNAVPSGEGYAREINIQLRNAGVGPADVRNVRVLVDGEPVASYSDWLAQCCANPEEARAAQDALDAMLNQSRTHFIPAGEEAPLFSARRTDSNGAAWDMAEQVRLRTAIEACYCSVFEECWVVNSRTDERQSVNACPATEDRFVP